MSEPADWKVLRDPIKAEWVVIDMGPDDPSFQVHPFFDFARNADLAEWICRCHNAGLDVSEATS